MTVVFEQHNKTIINYFLAQLLGMTQAHYKRRHNVLPAFVIIQHK
jgi:hypothetical protein